jgi:hypothetical protein
MPKFKFKGSANAEGAKELAKQIIHEYAPTLDDVEYTASFINPRSYDHDDVELLDIKFTDENNDGTLIEGSHSKERDGSNCHPVTDDHRSDGFHTIVYLSILSKSSIQKLKDLVEEEKPIAAAAPQQPATPITGTPPPASPPPHIDLTLGEPEPVLEEKPKFRFTEDGKSKKAEIAQRIVSNLDPSGKITNPYTVALSPPDLDSIVYLDITFSNQTEADLVKTSITGMRGFTIDPVKPNSIIVSPEAVQSNSSFLFSELGNLVEQFVPAAPAPSPPEVETPAEIMPKFRFTQAAKEMGAEALAKKIILTIANEAVSFVPLKINFTKPNAGDNSNVEYLDIDPGEEAFLAVKDKSIPGVIITDSVLSRNVRITPSDFRVQPGYQDLIEKGLVPVEVSPAAAELADLAVAAPPSPAPLPAHPAPAPVPAHAPAPEEAPALMLNGICGGEAETEATAQGGPVAQIIWAPNFNGPGGSTGLSGFIVVHPTMSAVELEKHLKQTAKDILTAMLRAQPGNLFSDDEIKKIVNDPKVITSEISTDKKHVQVTIQPLKALKVKNLNLSDPQKAALTDIRDRLVKNPGKTTIAAGNPMTVSKLMEISLKKQIPFKDTPFVGTLGQLTPQATDMEKMLAELNKDFYPNLRSKTTTPRPVTPVAPGSQTPPVTPITRKAKTVVKNSEVVKYKNDADHASANLAGLPPPDHDNIQVNVLRSDLQQNIENANTILTAGLTAGTQSAFDPGLKMLLVVNAAKKALEDSVRGTAYADACGYFFAQVGLIVETRNKFVDFLANRVASTSAVAEEAVRDYGNYILAKGAFVKFKNDLLDTLNKDKRKVKADATAAGKIDDVIGKINAYVDIDPQAKLSNEERAYYELIYAQQQYNDLGHTLKACKDLQIALSKVDLIYAEAEEGTPEQRLFKDCLKAAIDEGHGVLPDAQRRTMEKERGYIQSPAAGGDAKKLSLDQCRELAKDFSDLQKIISEEASPEVKAGYASKAAKYYMMAVSKYLSSAEGIAVGLNQDAVDNLQDGFECYEIAKNIYKKAHKEGEVSYAEMLQDYAKNMIMLAHFEGQDEVKFDYLRDAKRSLEEASRILLAAMKPKDALLDKIKGLIKDIDRLIKDIDNQLLLMGASKEVPKSIEHPLSPAKMVKKSAEAEDVSHRVAGAEDEARPHPKENAW